MSGVPSCVACGGGVEWSTRFGFHYPYGEQSGVCSACAEAIANVFWRKHSGEWLTWPGNDPRPDRKQPVPATVRWGVLRDAQYTCAECGAQDRPLHVDHIKPRAAGGGNERENLQALCDKCNIAKGAAQ